MQKTEQNELLAERQVRLLCEAEISEIEAQLNSGSLLLPLRVEGWHMSLSDGGWHIKNSFDRVVMTVRFVPVEIETGKPALEGNAPARHTAALLNSIPALCATVKHLRAQVAQLTEDRQTWLTWADGLTGNQHYLASKMRLDLQSQLEQLRAENKRLKKTNTGLFCNGCGGIIEGWPNVFRCVTPGCGRVYHEACLLKHCAKEVADVTTERDRLREDLRILTNGRFVQS